jgi:hypothetical protein
MSFALTATVGSMYVSVVSLFSLLIEQQQAATEGSDIYADDSCTVESSPGK